MPHSSIPQDLNLSPDVIRVPLGRDCYALIDAADAALVVQYRWYAAKVNKQKTYAAAGPVIDGKQVTIYLHRLLMNPPDGMEVDHINNDPLDCRRVNMRICTRSENMRNRATKAGKRFKGVYQTSKNSWYAQIYDGTKNLYLGSFPTEEDAAHAYDAKARELFGEFARLNFPDAESEAA